MNKSDESRYSENDFAFRYNLVTQELYMGMGYYWKKYDINKHWLFTLETDKKELPKEISSELTDNKKKEIQKKINKYEYTIRERERDIEYYKMKIKELVTKFNEL